MTDSNILTQDFGDIKGEVEYLFKGEKRKMGRVDVERIAGGLDGMLGKRADITSRVVAS
jgi:hypothetical protein